MSPAVNVTLEEVPFAILEAVKARILANRQRRNEIRQRPSLRPRPQFRNVGASNKDWRPPQPSAGVVPERIVVGAYWLQFLDDGYLVKTADESKEYRFTIPKIDLGSVAPPFVTVEEFPIREDFYSGPAIYTGSNTIVYKTRSVMGTGGTNRNYIQLPAGGKNVILCFYGQRASARQEVDTEMIYTYQTFLANNDPDNPAIGTNHQATHTYNSSTTAPFITEKKYAAILVSEKDIKPLVVPQQIIDLFEETSSSFVSGSVQPGSSVERGSYEPDILEDILASIDFPSPVEAGATFYVLGFGFFAYNGVEWTYQSFIPDNRLTVKSIGDNFPNATGFGNLSAGQNFYTGTRNYGVPEYTDNYTSTSYTPATTTFTSDGTLFPLFDVDLNLVGWNQERGQDLLVYTPAVFTTIKTREYIDARVDGVLTISDVVDTYLSDVPRPRYAIIPTILENVVDNSLAFKVRWDITRDLDVTDESRIITNNKAITPLDLNNTFTYYVYDWGQPNYCRQQCLNLGFTPADLRP
jgi:hypothetical protein